MAKANLPEPPIVAVTPMREDPNHDTTLIFNIGGSRHEVPTSTLDKIPSSLLQDKTALEKHYRKAKDDYFFDCHPKVFAALLAYGRTGELHVPKDLCGNLVRKELKFWGVEELSIEMCCWIKYKLDVDTKTTLLSFDKSMLSMKGRIVDKVPTSSKWDKLCKTMWTFFEKPSSSIPAMIYAAFAVVMVLTSITIFCMETHPTFKQNMTVDEYAEFYGVSVKEIIEDWREEKNYYDNGFKLWTDEEINGIVGRDTQNIGNVYATTIDYPENGTNGTEALPERLNIKYIKRDGELFRPNQTLKIIDRVCMVFFTLEILLRFLFSPKKSAFCRDILNIIDLLSILPFHIILIVEYIIEKEKYEINAFDAFYILKVLRVFRVFRLVRHNRGLRVLVYTVKESWKEVLLLITFIMVGMVIFASLIYFCEYGNDMFPSIPHGFWWAIVTMTTLGYGDVYPTSAYGYFVGAMCAVSGVLVIAFTVPSIVNNFILFYNHVQYAKKFKDEDVGSDHKI